MKRSLTDDQRAEVARRYEGGEKLTQLAAAFGCSTQPIIRAVRASGVQMRKGGAQPGNAARNRRFTPEQDIEVARRYKEGAAIRGIAEAFGVCPAAVHGALKRTGTPRRDGAPQALFTPSQDDEIAAAYAAGASLTGLAGERGCTPYAIRSALRRRGIATRSGGGRRKVFTPEQIVEMVRLYESGESQERVAERFSVSQAVVSRLLRANGVTMRMHARGADAHGAWKGGRIQVGPYVHVWVAVDDPMASMRNNIGYVPEHRLVMARHLGRPLRADETVHHKEKPETDNRIENLQLRQGHHGKGAAFCCGDCGSLNVVPVELA